MKTRGFLRLAVAFMAVALMSCALAAPRAVSEGGPLASDVASQASPHAGIAKSGVGPAIIGFSAPMVTLDPMDQSVATGATATFVSAATGNPTPGVQWLVSTDGGATYTAVPGATSTTLSFTTTVVQNGNLYRALFVNIYGAVNSAPATLAVTGAPVITQNPANVTMLEGHTANFSAAAAGNPTPTVKWQRSIDGGAVFSDQPGATFPTLSLLSALSMSGYQYRAVFTNSFGSATTTAGTLTVYVPPLVTTNPTDQEVTAGSTATFTAAATGVPAPTVQWESMPAGGPSYAIGNSTVPRAPVPSTSRVYSGKHGL